MRRVEHRIEHGEPAIDHLIPANWGDEKIARPGGGDISDANRLILFALLFLGAASRSSTGAEPHRGSTQSRRTASTCRLGASRAALQVGSARMTTGN
jgi:hypothetical protein